nr:MAG TPA: hypothetical protein [Caudoviricetes sp.]
MFEFLRFVLFLFDIDWGRGRKAPNLARSSLIRLDV